MSLRKHAEYKESGLPLTPIAPSHWSRTALKYLGNYQNGYPFKPEDRGEEGLPIIRISQLTSDDEPAYFKGELDQRVKVATGDLLFSWSATIDAYIWSRGDAWLNQHIFKVTESQEASKDFLYYVIKHIAPKLADFDAHGSTMRHIKKESLGEKLYIPPQQEQLAIANFLDRETAKIDALIAEQKRLIELLQEKRQAVISHAVTKGLNANAPMKDSGVEWLGEVPEHWETGKIKHYFRTTSGSTPNSDKPELYYTTEEDEHGTPWIRTTDIDNDEVNTAVVFITPKALGDTACKALPVNTVLVALYGGGGTVGKNGILKIEAAVNQALCGILPSPKALPEYVHKYIQFLRPFWMERAVSSRKAGNISQELVGDTTFPIPPLQEQMAILRAIEEKLKELDELAKQSSESLVLLEERRSALISAAVTGQIDVRGLVEAEAGKQ